RERSTRKLRSLGRAPHAERSSCGTTRDPRDRTVARQNVRFLAVASRLSNNLGRRAPTAEDRRAGAKVERILGGALGGQHVRRELRWLRRQDLAGSQWVPAHRGHET